MNVPLPSEPAIRRNAIRFTRLAAIAGFVFAALAISHILTGPPPAPDASGEEILRFISTNQGMHRAQAIVSVLGLLPLAQFVAGLLMPFPGKRSATRREMGHVDADRRGNTHVEPFVSHRQQAWFVLA